MDLSDGDQVPADIRILTANDMQVDNSSLTGESEPQERYPELQRDSNGKLITVPLEAVNLCFFTTIVTAGSGRGMVIGTGDRCAREAHERRARGPLLAGASATALAPPVPHLPPPSTSTPPPTCRRRFCCLPACPRNCPPAGL